MTHRDSEESTMSEVRKKPTNHWYNVCQEHCGVGVDHKVRGSMHCVFQLHASLPRRQVVKNNMVVNDVYM